MAKETVTIYPSEQFPQKQDRPKVPLPWAISFFQTILGSIPLDAKREAVVKNWDKISIDYVRVLSPTEEIIKDRRQAIAGLQAKVDAGQGLTLAEATTLLTLLRG